MSCMKSCCVYQSNGICEAGLYPKKRLCTISQCSMWIDVLTPVLQGSWCRVVCK
jgi:hypothetical protein